jgi:hypothetical protein
MDSAKQVGSGSLFRMVGLYDGASVVVIYTPRSKRISYYQHYFAFSRQCTTPLPCHAHCTKLDTHSLLFRMRFKLDAIIVRKPTRALKEASDTLGLFLSAL